MISNRNKPISTLISRSPLCMQKKKKIVFSFCHQCLKDKHEKGKIRPIIITGISLDFLTQTMYYVFSVQGDYSKG